MNKKMGVVSALIVLLLLSTVSGGFSAVPSTISYQGRLTDAAGTPVNGTVTMVFSIYNAASGGAAIWTETQSVAVSQGIYNVVLGSVIPIGLPFDVNYYIGLRVGSDAEMTPRQPLTSIGYAFRAEISNSAATVASVSGATFTNLAAIPGGAGIIPSANIPATTSIGAGVITEASVSATAAITTSKLNGPVSSIPGNGLGSLATKSSISSADISGPVDVAHGGTGTVNGSITGTGALTFTAGGANGNVNLAPTGTGTVDVNSKRVTGVATPSANNDAANKSYVDSSVGGVTRVSIGAAAAGANSDITSLGGLTTPLSIAQGGTGAASAAGARTGLGAAVSGANGDITSLTGLNTQAAIAVNPYGLAAGNTSELRFLELAANGGNYVGLKAPDALAGDIVWTLPAADGNPGQVLTTNGSGILGWVSPYSGTVTSVTASSPLASSGGATPDISLSGTVPVANGGTGAASAAAGRTNLGAAASGANSDITSLGGLTTALSIAQGGTGATTAAIAINNLIPSQSGNSGKYLTTNGTSVSWGSVSSGYSSVSTYTNSATPGGGWAQLTVDATCASGRLTGGGCSTSDPADDVLASSYPTSNTVWRCTWWQSGTGTLTAYAICIQ